MGFLMTIITAIGGMLGAIVLGLVKDEATAWLPTLNRAILAAAIRGVPSEEKKRYAEEWSAHVAEYPGKISQILQALRFLKAGMSMEEFDVHFIESKKKSLVWVMVATMVTQWGGDKFVGAGYNFWVEHLFGFANFAAAICFIWASYWVIRLRPYFMGERQPLIR